MEKPLILIVNDDAYEAKGLYALVEAAKDFGEVVVVVPDSSRSGMAHAITMNEPLRIQLYREEDGIKYYRTNGTPVDCVKLGQKVVLRDRKIDLVLSGINHGSNSSISLIYSGTMAAAIEASLENVKGVGFSLLDYSSDADFTASIHYAKKLIPQILKTEFPPQVSLNINIPKLPLEEIKGIKIVRQTKGYWNEDLEKRVDCFGRDYYWLSGYLVDQDPHTDTCQWALNNGYVSIQPVQVDMTAYHFINDLKFMEE
ncbi:MAG: 5'/3'-nucleotidase SurE [Bacteroidales bacterium]|nr:5'/3'-nucleotidase SurE [Bacteroidales bacterium]